MLLFFMPEFAEITKYPCRTDALIGPSKHTSDIAERCGHRSLQGLCLYFYI